MTQETTVHIRPLTVEDAEIYTALRLRALQEHPEAYGTSYAEALSASLDHTRDWLDNGAPDTVFFGAFADDQLLGMTGFIRNQREKHHHRALIAGVYVEPSERGKGYARAMLVAALDHAHQQEGLSDVVLAVTVGNHGARGLYLSAGFKPYMVEPRYLKIRDVLYDMEWMRLRLDDGE